MKEETTSHIWWQPLSMCCQNSIGVDKKSYLYQNQTFSPTHIWVYCEGWLLSGCSSVTVYWQLKIAVLFLATAVFFPLKEFPLCHIIPSQLFTLCIVSNSIYLRGLQEHVCQSIINYSSKKHFIF